MSSDDEVDTTVDSTKDSVNVVSSSSSTTTVTTTTTSHHHRDWAAVRRQQRLRRREREVALIAIQDPAVIAMRKERAAKRTLRMRDADQLPMRGRIVLDCQWDALMTRKDIISVTTQMSALYSVNRLLPEPFRIDVVGLAAADQLRTRIDSKVPEIRTWSTVQCHDASLLDHFANERDRLVYLVAESDNVLTDVSDEDIYIVGALVDHNSRLGICHQFALDSKIRTARLPLAESVALNSRKVLAINHVVAILCGHRRHAGNWAVAINDVMPTRKVAGIGTTKRERRRRGQKSSTSIPPAVGDERATMENEQNECATAEMVDGDNSGKARD